MLRVISKYLLKILGWNVIANFDPSIKKFVVIGAPHTSNWDGFFGILAINYLHMPIKFFGKKTLFKWPFGWFLKKLGGIPVDRKSSKNIVEQIVEKIQNADTFMIGMSPEGTRGYVERWRTGFYRIAEQAGIPIYIAGLDYGRKEVRLIRIIYPSGDYSSDLALLQKCYQDIKPKYPEKWNLEGITNT